jgi:hypothetical protein
MKCISDILQASSKMVDNQLEVTDETTYLVTIKNCSDRYTANNVAATIFLVGGCVDGIKVIPDDRYFGTILPKKSVTKEIAIITERAPVGDHKLGYHLSFSAAFDKCEGEETDFTVTDD